MKTSRKSLLIYIISIILSVCILAGTVVASADELQTQWNVSDLSVDIKAGENGYTFRSIYLPPHAAYEMSNHMVTYDFEHYDIPQTLVLVEASTDYTWTPSGPYSFQNSNYEVLYCCDASTGYSNDVYYKRMNLEDSDYYDEESASHIRSIVTNAYPYISLDQMRSNLAAAGFEYAKDLTRADIITAVQSAIWAYANTDVPVYYYGRTFHIPTSTRWGGVMHDYTAEMGEPWWNTGAHKVTGKSNTTDENVLAEIIKVETRINALIDYLIQLAPTEPDDDQIIISNLGVTDFSPIQKVENLYTVSFRVKLNNGANSEDDDLKLDIYVDGEFYSSQKIAIGQTVYNLTAEAEPGQKIKVVVHGTQSLPYGVYFYESAGGRDVSQSLVGVSCGTTDIYSEGEVDFFVEEEPVTADVSLFKTDEKSQALSGAKFALYALGNNTDIYAATYTADRNGTAAIKNLVPGDYKLIETEAPVGFIPLRDPIFFSVTKTGDVVPGNLPEGVTSSASDNGFALTCVNLSDSIDLSGSKTWNDSNNNDGIRPESITVNLMADGVEVAEKTVTADSNWSWTFEDLPRVREDGSEIVYTVTEDIVEGYTPVYDGLNITNNHENETVDIYGNKTWMDNNNYDGIRPESIVINLLADGVEVAEKTVTADSDWTWNFTDMPKYRDGGIEIVYTVTEDAVAGYTSSVDGYNVTNFMIPPRKSKTPVSFGGIKYLDGQKGGGFYFHLTDDNGNLIDDAVSASTGIFSFAPIEYTEAGVYKYHIFEVPGDDENIVYDDSVYDITVTVTESDNTLTTRVSVFKNAAEYTGPIEFYNDSTTDIPEEDPPLTGDNNLTPLYFALMLGSLAAFGTTVFLLKKRSA